MSQKNKNKLKKIFISYFPNFKFVDKKFEKLDINNVPEWDSLKNLNMLLDVEKKFNFKMNLEDMSEVRSIKSILNIINKNV